MTQSHKRHLFGSFTQLVLVFNAMIFFPIIGYTIFQWLEKNKSETVIESIYDRQLKSVLFTVNQHSWDEFRTWMDESGLAVGDTASPLASRERLVDVLELHRPLLAVLIGTRNQLPLLVVKDDTVAASVSTSVLTASWLAFFRDQSGEVDRALQIARDGYIRPLPVSLVTTTQTMASLVLFPILKKDRSEPLFVALLIDQRRLIDLVVAPKFIEMGEENFVFAVRKRPEGYFLYLSQEEAGYEFEKHENLWILPELELHIKLQGATLHQLAHSRIRVNLLFISAVDFLLIIGALFLIRIVRAQIALAKMKTDFVANVSHELRTPLSLIQMYAEMLDMGRVLSDEKRKRYYRTILYECTRLTKLINQVLDFSKIESNEQEFTFESVFLPGLVHEVLESFREHLDRSGFQLEEQLDETVPLITANADSVTQALVNLLDNSIKFSTENKEIGVRLFQKDAYVVLEVRDKGVGIATNEKDKIFLKFYRGGDSLVHDTRGSGLGLALVKHIMDIHQGRVQVFSRMGEGSVFQLLFPINKKGGKWLVS